MKNERHEEFSGNGIPANFFNRTRETRESTALGFLLIVPGAIFLVRTYACMHVCARPYRIDIHERAGQTADTTR